jgi:hypothetical protein
MFVLCPHCHFLVATDPASGQPPLRCARCQGLLVPEAEKETETETATQAPAPDATQDAAKLEPASDEDAEPVAALVADIPPESTFDIDEVVVVETGVADAAPAQVADPVPASDPTPIPAPAPVRGRARKPRKKPRAPTATPSVPASVPAPDEAPAEAAAAPGFVQRQRVRIARSSHTQRWMVMAIGLLSVLLVLQLLLADRATLARDARWRPVMSTMCGALRCTLPAWREPAAFTLLDRDVRPRPGMPGVLRVTATFRNDARWPQPWPALLLTLSDLDGRAVGARVFMPREYLGAAPGQATLASGQSAMLSMDVLEPGPRIVAFTFDFR